MRRWCLPPPWTREPGELLEGMFVLEELPPDLALALWTAFRDVTLWAGTPAERRPGLFSAGAEARRPRVDGELRLPPALTPPLTTLVTVVSHPGQVSEQVAPKEPPYLCTMRWYSRTTADQERRRKAPSELRDRCDHRNPRDCPGPHAYSTKTRSCDRRDRLGGRDTQRGRGRTSREYCDWSS